MRDKYLKIKYLCVLLFAMSGMNAQNEDPMGGQCGSGTLHSHLMATDSAYAGKMNRFETHLKQNANRSAMDDPILIIPVVVHIMHKGEAIGTGTNISDQAVLDKIKAINDNFRKALGTKGYGNGVDIGIEFALAVRDPNGLCTNGIERIDMSSNAPYMNYGARYTSANGILWGQLKAISSWNTAAYYNLYMISEIDNNDGGSGTQGIADFATSHGLPSEGAVVIANPTVPTISPGNIESHELGHALNLYHTFEGDGNYGLTCPLASGCGWGAGDCCADTPPHKRGNGSISCYETTNSCQGNSTDVSYEKNYMNYCTDVHMFTADQKTRMRQALLTIRYSYLLQNGNTSLLPTAAPTANYKAENQTVCNGESIRFYDRSSCISNIYSNTSVSPSISFNWVFTNGSTVITSTLQNPKIKFTVPGSYTLAYTVANSFGTNTLTVPNAVTVNSIAALACTPSSDFVGSSGYSIMNVNFNTISNYSQQGKNDGYRDFSCTKNTVVNANQSYYLELKASSYSSTLYSAAYIDYNNNGNFEANEKIFDGQLAPFASLYTYTTAVSIPGNTVKNTYLRMRVIGSATPITDDLMNCSASYGIGDIEDYAVLVLSPLSNQDFSAGTVLFPNPVKGSFTIESLADIEKVQVYSGLGQLIFEKNYQEKKVTLDAGSYSAGIYFVFIETDGKRSFYKIIKE